MVLVLMNQGVMATILVGYCFVIPILLTLRVTQLLFELSIMAPFKVSMVRL